MKPLYHPHPQCMCTLGPAYNEFGYNEHPDTKSKLFSVELTPSSFTADVKKFMLQWAPSYNKHFFMH